MRFVMQFHTVYIMLVLLLTACTLARADPEIHTTLSLNIFSENDHSNQKPVAAPNADSSYVYPAHQPMQAASEAVSTERPIGNMVVAVVVSGIVFGLGMGM
ncbi:hypothetical protein M3J09_000252 [Ascochyta lentis]